MRPEIVSIMMPAYNAEQYIAHAIESVLEQRYSKWELIVVNDGSTDKTASIIAQFTDPRIKVFHQPNGGEAAARNTALKHMQGEYLAFLDADDLYLPHHLEVTICNLKAHPDCSGVYTDGYHCDPKGTQLQTLSSRRRGPFEGWIFENVVRASDVFGPPLCVVLRRNIIIQHNLEFDEGIVIGPDWDFMTRYSGLAKFGYVNQFTCLYRIHETNITFRTDLSKRALHLAKCRSNAIKLDSFKTCSVETRWFVFYDLLVNLLMGFPEQQSTILEWPEFRDLPAELQAQITRLMASKAILKGDNPTYVQEWLRVSRRLNPGDRRGSLLAALYHLSPRLCQFLIRARAQRAPRTVRGSRLDF